MDACGLLSLPKQGAIVSNRRLICVIVSYNHFSLSIMVALRVYEHHQVLFNLASIHDIVDLAA